MLPGPLPALDEGTVGLEPDMAKQLDAEELAEQIRTLESRARDEARAEILAEITDAKFVREDDADTWQAGVDAVVTFIRNNY